MHSTSQKAIPWRCWAEAKAVRNRHRRSCTPNDCGVCGKDGTTIAFTDSTLASPHYCRNHVIGGIELWRENEQCPSMATMGFDSLQLHRCRIPSILTHCADSTTYSHQVRSWRIWRLQRHAADRAIVCFLLLTSHCSRLGASYVLSRARVEYIRGSDDWDNRPSISSPCPHLPFEP